MFTWIIEALQGITETHTLLALLPFCVGVLNEGESHEEGFARVEGELATANTDLATAKDAAGKAGNGTWKGGLGADLGNSPLLSKFEDTPEGLNQAFTSHAGLEKLLGHEKVPIPKGPDDVEGHARFNKAMGIPDAAAGYGLADAEVPESMKNMSFSKEKFGEVMHGFKLTPNQAQGLWGAYTEMSKDVYGKALKAHEDHLVEVTNEMRGEWGDAFEGNVALGQLVIDKFSSDKETEDFITSTIMKDPRGIRFLSKIGGNFAENKIGDFKHTRFSLSPEQAQAEYDKISGDANHPYRNEKASDAEHQAALDYVNRLLVVINSGKAQ